MIVNEEHLSLEKRPVCIDAIWIAQLPDITSWQKKRMPRHRIMCNWARGVVYEHRTVVSCSTDRIPNIFCLGRNAPRFWQAFVCYTSWMLTCNWIDSVSSVQLRFAWSRRYSSERSKAVFTAGKSVITPAPSASGRATSVTKGVRVGKNAHIFRFVAQKQFRQSNPPTIGQNSDWMQTFFGPWFPGCVHSPNGEHVLFINVSVQVQSDHLHVSVLQIASLEGLSMRSNVLKSNHISAIAQLVKIFNTFNNIHKNWIPTRIPYIL